MLHGARHIQISVDDSGHRFGNRHVHGVTFSQPGGDGSRNGTRVARDGSTLDVLRGDPVGVAIQSGDEIQLGSAAIKVRID